MLKFFRKNNIGEPPWEYSFLYNLPASEYPKYLAKIFNYRTGEKLPLKWDFKTRAWVIDKKRCKTFNQKIQWIKLYGVTDLMRKCTDKVAVRDYVAEKIGEEYLKPALQIIGNCSPSTSGRGRGEGITLAEDNVATYFDQINWEKLPNAFVIKTNHGCKWQYIIKNKEKFLNIPPLFETVKRNITGWLEQEYCFWGGFEMQYKAKLCTNKVRLAKNEMNACDSNVNDSSERKQFQEGIESKILIEPLMRDEINTLSDEIQVYCFSGIPKLFIELHGNKTGLYDERLNVIDNVFSKDYVKTHEFAEDLLNHSFVLSKQISKEFNFIRVDWMIYKNKLYFEELTFTPASGLLILNKNTNLKLAKL